MGALTNDDVNKAAIRECDDFIIIFLLESFLAPKASQAVEH